MAEEKKCEEEKGKNGGELLFCGPTNWSTAGKKGSDTRGNLYAPTRLRPLAGINIRYVASGCVSLHCVALDVDGRCYTWGRNEKGQLGHGDIQQRDRPTVVSDLSQFKIVMASAGRSHTVVVTDDGRSFAFGWNKHGQLGSGSLEKEVETSPVRCEVSDATTVACGGEFTVWLSSAEGASILSAGLPQYGQLGHGTENVYNSKNSSVKLVYEPQSCPKAIASFSKETIVKVACGNNHTVAVDSNGYVSTWGCGDYGRLGHREQKDEFIPRRVDVFTRSNVLPPDALVSAGYYSSACTADQGQLYMWGKLKFTGDEWMYPKPVRDLSGWNLRCMDSGNMFQFVGAESSCISWGLAQDGQLGYGPNEQKSSANPKKVDILEGMHVISVACGFVHSMVVVDRTDVIDRLEQLNVYDGEEPTEANEIIEPATSAKKTPKKSSNVNSKKRKKSKAISESEDEKDEESDDGEAVARNGDMGKRQRGGKAGGRGLGSKKSLDEAKSNGGGRPKGSRGRPCTEISEPVTRSKRTPKKSSDDNSNMRMKMKEISEAEEESDDGEAVATNGNRGKSQRGRKAGGIGGGNKISPDEVKSNVRGRSRSNGSRGRPRK